MIWLSLAQIQIQVAQSFVFFCRLFVIRIQNTISYQPIGTMADINNIVQLILLSICMGGFDLLDFLIMLLFLILNDLSDFLTSPWLKKTKHINQNCQQLTWVATRLAHISKIPLKTPGPLQSLLESLEEYFSSQSQETVWNFDSKASIKVTFS